ncbi:MAG: B12-binding domain-containing radical SAM protein [Treponema sp.]|jgi:radical SAM superfamily enzyme YgiQ (UPF0313 family)|nr:B12-binding domain-containing radical SAM protein [Treponema sp.]
MPDILLTTINAKWIHPSLALRLLKANLGHLEDRAEILEFALRQPMDVKIKTIFDAKPKILGVSVSIWNHQQTLEVLDQLETLWNAETPRPVIILGGPEAGQLEKDLPLYKAADWIINGEGEDVFRELCEIFLTPRSLRHSKGPCDFEYFNHQLQNNRFIKSIDEKTITSRQVNLETIDPAYRLYTDEDVERKLTYVESSRGCPFGCEFCLSSLDRQVRYFPLDDFLENMKQLIHRGAKGFKFLDRTFNLDFDRAKLIMEFFLRNIKAPMYVHFEMVPSRFPDELRSLLTQFPEGTLRLEVGIQTFNPLAAKIIGRPSDPKKELESLAFLKNKTNAIVHADLIAGLPGEDYASFAEGFDRLWSVRPTEIQMGILKRLPGTPICQRDSEHGMMYSAEPPYEVMQTNAVSKHDMDRMKNFARFWELIVNRGHFEDFSEKIFPEDKAIFHRFMKLSDWLLKKFGQNWGIDRKLLREALEEWDV